MIEVRLRTRVSDAELEQKVGKIVTDDDYNLLITRDTRVLTPEGDVLCVYRRGAIADEVMSGAYPTLHSLKALKTDNRGLASGTRRMEMGAQKRTRTAPVSSAIIGSFDPTTPKPYCRLTAWTGEKADAWRELRPLFQNMARVFAEEVPDRYAVQAARAEATQSAWVIQGTPYTTITVNNTYPTGVHTDSGDLDEGFSCLACCRRGAYTGGVLVFPRYRVAVDMRDRDIVMMNAHEWHGNTMIKPWESEDDQAERISIVAYYRTDMLACGSAEAELAKAQRASDERTGLFDSMALPL